jgi:hypothetical protein
MKKITTALVALSVLGTGFAAAPAQAGDRDRVSREEIRRDRAKLREEAYEYRQAQRYGSRADIREERREYRAAKRELREDQRDLRRARGYHDGRRYNERYYDDRGYYARNDYRPAGWYGRNGAYYGDDYARCRRDSNTDGTVLGAVVGGALGNVIAKPGDKTLGTAIGAGLGGVVGNRIDNGKGRRYC